MARKPILAARSLVFQDSLISPQLHDLLEHPGQRENVRPQFAFPGAELVRIEQLGDDRATRHRAARQFIIVVRPVGGACQFDALADEKLDHARRFGHIAAAAGTRRARRVLRIPDHRVEVGQRFVAAVLDAVAPHEWVVGYPHHAAGACRGTPDQAGLLENQRALTGVTHDQARTHGSAAASHRDKVEGLIETVHTISPCLWSVILANPSDAINACAVIGARPLRRRAALATFND